MKISWIVALALIFLIAPSAGAISTPDVTFIPGQISVNSSFILIADPHASSGESVSVKWVVYGIENGFGSIPFTGTRYVCYFSNTDMQNTCGPNIFPASSYGVPYEMQVNASNQYGQTESTSLNVSIGGIPIQSEIVVSGNSVYIKSWAGNPIEGTISYKVYDSAGLNVLKSGTMVYNVNIYGYTANISLSNGEYYIAFTASSSTDFGGGVARVVVGEGGPSSPDVQADSIVYSPVINPGQEFSIETFKITNLGTDNLTALSISVPQQISSYLSIIPKKTSLEPNESMYMIVSIHNIESSSNISTFATLLSGSEEIKQIPVELRISVIGGINPESCVGKNDKELCLGGICCAGVCRTGGAECCSDSDCDAAAGETCSTDYKCVPGVVPGECEGESDMSACTGGICCGGSCITGGECCSDSDCTGIDETCSYSNLCVQSQKVCTSSSDCYGNACCDGQCCSSGETCQDGYCTSAPSCTTNEDCGNGEVCQSGSCITTEPTPIDITTIALIGGGVVAAAVVGFILFKKFRKGGKEEGEEEFEEGGEEKEEDEFSDEDFY